MMSRLVFRDREQDLVLNTPSQRLNAVIIVAKKAIANIENPKMSALRTETESIKRKIAPAVKMMPKPTKTRVTVTFREHNLRVPTTTRKTPTQATGVSKSRIPRGVTETT
jgi:hypothetical protein